MEKLKLGSVYFARTPVNIESCYQHPEGLAIGDTVPGREISWIRDRDRLIADRAVCYGMSWKELNEMGLIFGKLIFIDGNPYICHSLSVGTPGTIPNEWDDLLDRYGEDDDLWHWKNIRFWGQESEKKGSRNRVLRGWSSARSWKVLPSGGTDELTGFRPVLEVLPPAQELTEELVGKQVKVFGPEGVVVAITGTLADFDGYDLVLTNTGPLPRSCSWASRRDKKTIINKSAIVFLQKIG